MSSGQHPLLFDIVLPPYGLPGAQAPPHQPFFFIALAFQYLRLAMDASPSELIAEILESCKSSMFLKSCCVGVLSYCVMVEAPSLTLLRFLLARVAQQMDRTVGNVLDLYGLEVR